MIRYCRHCQKTTTFEPKHSFSGYMDDYVTHWFCKECGERLAAPRIKGIVVTHTRIKGIVTERKERS